MDGVKDVHIVEVGARDGLQNHPQLVSESDKIEFINLLSHCGYQTIEVTSFTSPEWVPQLADHAAVYKGIEKLGGVQYPVLVPNQQGLEEALAAGVQDIALFTAVSDAFTQKNMNCTVEESLVEYAKVARGAIDRGLRVRGYVSTVIACPYAGAMLPADVATVAKRLFDMGCYEISLGDTIGVGTAATIRSMLEAVISEIPVDALAGHYHDTYGQALTNIYASLDMGIRTFDSSVSGLGGCPYAEGASGNVATEDVLYLLQGLGLQTGIDLEAVIEAGQFIDGCLGRISGSKVAQAMR